MFYSLYFIEACRVDFCEQSDVRFYFDGSVGERIENINCFSEIDRIDYDPNKVVVTKHSCRQYNLAQTSVNSKLQTVIQNGVELFFDVHGNLTNPKKIVFVFPSLSLGDRLKKHHVTKMKKGYASTYEDTVFIAFQDNYSCFGTHLQFDDRGNDLRTPIINFIRNKILEFGLTNSDAIFIGNSKGGTLAMFYGSFFDYSTVIAVAGHKDLRSLMTLRNMGTFYQYLFKRFGYFDFIDNKISAIDMIYSSNIKLYFFKGELDIAANFNELYCYYPNQVVYSTPFGHDVTANSIGHQYLLLDYLTSSYTVCDGLVNSCECSVDRDLMKLRITFDDVLVHGECFYLLKVTDLESGYQSYYDILPYSKLIDGERYAFGCGTRSNGFEQFFVNYSSSLEFDVLIVDPVNKVVSKKWFRPNLYCSVDVSLVRFNGFGRNISFLFKLNDFSVANKKVFIEFTSKVDGRKKYFNVLVGGKQNMFVSPMNKSSLSFGEVYDCLVWDYRIVYLEVM